ILPLTIASAVSAQQTPVTIRGRVVAAENSQPMRRALVTPVRPARNTPPAMTDDEGRFEFVDGEGLTSLIVSKGGYTPSTVEIKRDVAKSREELEVRLARGAAISGRILRSSGEPVVGARVRASRLDQPDAKEQRTVWDATTDDLGEFRISGLAS